MRRIAPEMIVNGILNDDMPIGTKFAAIRHMKECAEQAERRLLMQLGVDAAKYLFAKGIQPTDRPISETFAEMDAREDTSEEGRTQSSHP